MALVLGDEELGARIARIRISNLRFADGISLLAESKGELQQLVNRVSQTSTRFGLASARRLRHRRRDIKSSKSINKCLVNNVTRNAERWNDLITAFGGR